LSKKEDLMKVFGEAEVRSDFKSPVKPLITQAELQFRDDLVPNNVSKKQTTAFPPDSDENPNDTKNSESNPPSVESRHKSGKKKQKLSKVLYNIFSDRTFCKMLNSFVFCMAVNCFEYFYLINTKNIQTRGAIGKIFGIIVIFIFMFSVRLKPKHIGIPLEPVPILKGLKRALIFSCAIVPAYLFDIIVVLIKGGSPHLIVFAYDQPKSLSGTVDWIANILLLLVINALSAFMLEVLFRGIIYRMGKTKFGFGQTTFIISLFYALWYLMIPLSKITKASLARILPLCIFYFVLEFFISIKLCLCTRASGSVWLAIFDHFIFTASTSIIRVLDNSVGASNYIDVNKYWRYLVFQIVSFILCYIYYKKKMLLRKKVKKASKSHSRVIYDSFADLTPTDVSRMKTERFDEHEKSEKHRLDALREAEETESP